MEGTRDRAQSSTSSHSALGTRPSELPPPPSAHGVVIFAGGGTGGHLYPGLAIAEELRAYAKLSGKTVSCVFVCSDRPLDAEILRKAQETAVASPAKPLALRPRGLFRFMRTWGRAVREARGVLRNARKDSIDGRVVVVAMGGFVAAPVAQAARVERVPIVLVNLDAVPGKANRFIAWRARHQRGVAGNGEGVVSTIPVRSGTPGEWPVVGPIVRERALAAGAPEECRLRLGLDPKLPVLMVTGGSQGAKSINNLMVEYAKREAPLLAGWQILHQCGKAEEDGVRRGYAEAGIPATRAIVQEFSDRMGDWWGAAELAVSRSGAGSVAEAWANRVACVFLPYPFHKDEHQRWNAEPLSKAGGAVLAKDAIDARANMENAGKELARLMRDAGARAAMREALATLGPAKGAADVARRVMKMLGA